MVRGETQAAPRSAFDLSSSRLPRWFLFSSIHPPGARRPPIHPRKIFASCPLFRLLYLRLYLSHSLPSAELLLTSFLRFFSSTLQLLNSGSSFKMDAPSTNDSPQLSASPRLAARLVQRSAHIATRTCTHPARRGPLTHLRRANLHSRDGHASRPGVLLWHPAFRFCRRVPAILFWLGGDTFGRLALPRTRTRGAR